MCRSAHCIRSVIAAAEGTNATMTGTAVAGLALLQKSGGDQHQAFISTSRAAAADEGDNVPEDVQEITNPKVVELADQITQLNLLEVSELTELLKKRLNIQAPMGGMAFPMMGGGAMAPGAGGAAGGAGEAAPAKEEKTEFTLKLEGFDAASKIKVIKEVRGIVDLGLKEAKELVEKAPAVLKENLSKEEAEELKTKLEAAGAKIVLE